MERDSASPDEICAARKSSLDTVPLCIDLDGTLLKSNSLVEAAFAFLRERPLTAAFLLLVWGLRGKAYLWERLAARSPLRIEGLPYRSEIVALAMDAHRTRATVLVTGCHESMARRIADHLGCFSQVIATEGGTHLVGHAKASRLSQLYGAGGFDYIGDSPAADGPVWKLARRGFIVGAGGSQGGALEQVTVTRSPLLKAVWKELRPHHWTKNLLVMLAVVTSHQLNRLPLVSRGLLATLAFCAAASAVYVCNDLFDLEPDRCHPAKKLRPLAAGDLPIPLAVLLAATLGIGALVGAALLRLPFALILAVYMAASFAYSVAIKRVLMADVIVLTCLYVARVFAGGVAVGIAISFWATNFCLFFFFSLAALKRYSELRRHGHDDGPVNRRGYRAEDMRQLNLIGLASGLISVCVLALYINAPDVRNLYRTPEFLWFLCPLVLYWFSRVWVLAGRGEVQEDPIVFALTDKPSYLICLLMGLVAFAAM